MTHIVIGREVDYRFRLISMTLFRSHGRDACPISLWDLGSHTSAGNKCPTSHLASLARRRGPRYPVGWWRFLQDRVSRELACKTSPRAKLESDRY